MRYDPNEYNDWEGQDVEIKKPVTANMIFTSGDPNFLSLDDAQRRFIVVDNSPATMGLNPATIQALREEGQQVARRKRK